MNKTIQRPVDAHTSKQLLTTDWVTPSHVDSFAPFTVDQELEVFGTWTSQPIWVPPKGSSKAMAETMLSKTKPFASAGTRWQAVIDQHRDNFTQVREIDLARASIRLPKGKLFVSVTEQQDFDQITDKIPACVQTRLDEFLQGPGKQPGVKVYYLKPLCVEVDDKLILTTAKDLHAAITKIQDEVFAEYRRWAPLQRSKDALVGAVDLGLAIPRKVVNYYVQRKQRALDAYQARLEFERRKTALAATHAHRQCRTNGCTFDEMLELTNPLRRTAVAEQFAIENKMSKAQRDYLIRVATNELPWFITLSMGVSQVISLGIMLASYSAPPVMVADPAFVAEIPGSEGEVLKIGHFDEVAGVTHVEI